MNCSIFSAVLHARLWRTWPKPGSSVWKICVSWNRSWLRRARMNTNRAKANPLNATGIGAQYKRRGNDDDAPSDFFRLVTMVLAAPGQSSLADDSHCIGRLGGRVVAQTRNFARSLSHLDDRVREIFSPLGPVDRRDRKLRVRYFEAVDLHRRRNIFPDRPTGFTRRIWFGSCEGRRLERYHFAGRTCGAWRALLFADGRLVTRIRCLVCAMVDDSPAVRARIEGWKRDRRKICSGGAPASDDAVVA